jgi:hypothetical protein
MQAGSLENADVSTDLFPKDEYFLNRRKFSPDRHPPKNANP